MFHNNVLHLARADGMEIANFGIIAKESDADSDVDLASGQCNNLSGQKRAQEDRPVSNYFFAREA